MGTWFRIGSLALLLCLSACGPGNPGDPGGHGAACEQDTDCDDGVDCTQDLCVPGALGVMRCEHVPRDSACATGQECVLDSVLGSGCRPRTALWCAGLKDGESCTPGDPCAGGPGTCRYGKCEYTRRKCQERPCQVSQGCDSGTGECAYLPALDGTLCDRDNDSCTDDLCHDGVCEPGIDKCECSNSRPCPAPADLCLGVPACQDNRCVPDPVRCEPTGDPCRENVCDSGTGACGVRDAQDGTPCPDDLQCTVAETCLEGLCVVSPLTCEPRPCQDGYCVENDGCLYEPVTNGTPCDDNDLCNGTDSCLDGVCTPAGGPDCDDGLPCTADSCDPDTGLCIHVPLLDCCGNGILEPGEDCDLGPHPVQGCDACSFAAVTVARTGFSPAVGWLNSGESGWILSERIVQSQGYQVELREVSANGTFGPAFQVSEPVIRPRWAWPAMAVLASDNLLVAYHEDDRIEVRLLDSAGELLARKDLAIPEGFLLPWTGRIVLVPTSSGAVMAFETTDESRRVLWMLTIRPDPSGLVMGTPLSLITAGIDNDLPLLGGGCSGDGRVLLTMRIDDPVRPIEQAVGLFDEDDLGRPAIRYLGPAGPLALPVIACAQAGPGRFLLVHEALSTDPEPAFRLVSRVVDADGKDLDEPDGPPCPTVLASGMDEEQDVYVWRYLPNFLSLVAMPGEGFLLGATFGSARFVTQPKALAFRYVILDRDGIPGDSFVPVPDQVGPFSFALALAMRPDGVALAAWTEGDTMLQYFQGGTTMARFLRLP